MTTTDERIAGTALEQVAPGSGAYVMATDTTKPWTLAALTERLAGEPARPAAVAPPKAPETVKITPELKAALRRLPEVFGGVQPTEPRKLEEAEVERLTIEQATLDAVITELGKRSKAIAGAVRHHVDALARENGITGPVITDGVGKGHIIAATPQNPFEVPVAGFSDPWQQRFVKGSSSLNLGLLADLLDQGQVTPREFLELTIPVRELDEGKIRAAVRKRPSRTLSIMRAITVRKPDSASLYSPKK